LRLIRAVYNELSFCLNNQVKPRFVLEHHHQIGLVVEDHVPVYEMLFFKG